MKNTKESLIIGICGRTASGKTSAAKLLQNELIKSGLQVGVLSLDDFYKPLSKEDHNRALKNEYDFDCLEAFDFETFHCIINNAKHGKDVRYYPYDHKKHNHKSNQVTILGKKDVWIVEGLYLFADTKCNTLYDMRIFMGVDGETSLARRIRRDTKKRNRTVAEVLFQYEKYVIPAYHRLVEPSKNKAHLIVLGGSQNRIAMDAILHSILFKINQA